MLKVSTQRLKQLYIGISLIPIAVAAFGFYALLNSPYTGFVFESKNKKWHVASVVPGSPAAAHPEVVGKEVVAIGGFRLWELDLFYVPNPLKDLDSYVHYMEARKFFSENVKVGEPLTITLEDSEIQVTPSAFPLAQVFSRVSAGFLFASVFLIILLAVALKRPDDISAISLFLFGLFCALDIFPLTSNSARDIALDFRAFITLWTTNIFAYASFPAMLLHFMIVFPQSKRMSTYFRAATKAVYVFFSASAFSILGVAVLGVSYYFVRFYEVTSLLCAFGSFAVLIYSYFTVKDISEKAQVKVVIFGFAVFIILFLIYHIAGIIYGPSYNVIVFPVIIVSVIAIMGSMVFAIMKYRLMDIDTLFDNTLIYSITMALLALLDMGVFYALTKLKVVDLNAANPFLAIFILVWIVIFAYVPIRNRVKTIIKRLLKRETYDANSVALELCSDLLGATDAQAALDKTTETINKALHPKEVKAFLYGANQPPLLPFKDAVGKFRDIKAPANLFTIFPSEDLSGDYSGGAIVPITGSTGRLGYILLKDKQSERLYDREDMKLLEIISSQTSMCIEAIRHKEEAERRDREASREKERLTREIHDGISSEFSGIMAYTERLKGHLGSGDAGQMQMMLENIEASSQRGVQELRNIISAIGTEDKTLDFVMSYIKRQSRDLLDAKGIALTFKGTAEGIVLGSSVVINLIRIGQEACHNVIKHSGATAVTMEFKKEGGALVLEIEDNGKGFDPDAAENNQGHGLKNMKKRMKGLGGEIFFTAQPGKGAKIRAAFPI